MCNLRLLFLVAMSTIATSTVTLGGSVRYELSELLGEHIFDGSRKFPFGRSARVDTPFGFYSVHQATLVVEGTVYAGKAHGDGILREAREFDLEPSVIAAPSFNHTILFGLEPVSGTFRIHDVYPNPFHPDVTPLPNPNGHPPISFNVWLSVGPSLSSDYPPLLSPPDPDTLVLGMNGVIVDVPIVANISEAYIRLTGPSIVPEPASGEIAAIAALFCLASCRLRGRRLRSWRRILVGRHG